MTGLICVLYTEARRSIQNPSPHHWQSRQPKTIRMAARFWTAPALPPPRRAKALLRCDGGWRIGECPPCADSESAIEQLRNILFKAAATLAVSQFENRIAETERDLSQLAASLTSPAPADWGQSALQSNWDGAATIKSRFPAQPGGSGYRFNGARRRRCRG
jgi:hypothetical protein